MLKKLFLILILLSSSTILYSQNDSIKLANGDIIIGKVKGMSQSVLTFKTKYSDSDFKIKWLQVKEFYSQRTFVISRNDGKRIYSKINTNPSNKEQVILNNKGREIYVPLSDINFIDRFDSNFFSRVHAAVDAGITLRKAQNYQEVTSNLDLSYSTQKWKFSSSISTIFNKQDRTQNITRNEISLNSTRFLPKDWFVIVLVDFLSNSDQDLELRATQSIGGGYYFKNNNQLTFGGAAGLSNNNETYLDEINPPKRSVETFFTLQFNKYNIGKLSMNFDLTAAPSITEKGRFRVDSNLYFKYKVTSDLYIKTSLTYNFDNQPAAGASKGDYVFQTTFGWDNN